MRILTYNRYTWHENTQVIKHIDVKRIFHSGHSHTLGSKNHKKKLERNRNPGHKSSDQDVIWNLKQKLTFRFASQLPVHKALPSADKPKQLIRPSCEFCKEPKFKTTCVDIPMMQYSPKEKLK